MGTEQKIKTKAIYSPVISLEDALHFTADELELNRDGTISDGQLNKLWNDLASRAVLSVLIVLGLTLFGLVLAGNGADEDGLPLMVIFFTLAAFVMLGVLAVPAYKGWLDFRLAEADTLQGRISLDISSQGKSGLVYSLRIGGEKFGLNKDRFLAFKNGEPYAIYFAPHSKKILSAEWLREI